MKQIAVIGLGGAIGAVMRWSLGELLDRPPAGTPWATLTVNLVGCLAIGLAARHWLPGTDRWAFGVTGLLGGFTTFSSFADETRELIAADRPATALAIVAVTLAGGVIAVRLGRGANGPTPPTTPPTTPPPTSASGTPEATR